MRLWRPASCIILVLILCWQNAPNCDAQAITFPGSESAEEEEDANPRSANVRAEGDAPGDPCTLISGPAQEMSCVFPFTFEDEEYEVCITIADPEDKPWCSTKVDAAGNHIVGGGHWGHCDPATCPLFGPPAAASAPGILADSPPSFAAEEEEEIESFPACVTARGEEGQCQPAVLCVGLTDDQAEEDTCELVAGSGQSLGVCCVDRTTAGGLMLQFGEVALDEEDRKAEEEAPQADVSLEEINRLLAARFGSTPQDRPAQAVNFDPGSQGDVTASPAEASLPPPSAVEDAAGPALEDVRRADDDDLHLRFQVASPEALAADSTATKLLLTVSDAQFSQGQPFSLRMFDKNTSPLIDRECPWTPAPDCGRRAKKYRSHDGTCNSLVEPNFGRAATPYQRIRVPEYGSNNIPRRSRIRMQELPSARQISTSLTQGSNRLDNLNTVLVMQMGQFIDHDITHTPTSNKRCCGQGNTFPAQFDTDQCFPIPIPANDRFWKGNRRCLSFPRSLKSPNLKCSLETREQVNQITHWLDGSNIYGSSEKDAKSLRQTFGGLLKVTRQSASRGGAMPTCSAQLLPGETAHKMCSGCPSCFFAGDVRVNEQHNLIVMHTVWMREHNRLARSLAKLNPHWDDETLYQEARRINVAQYQHIIYKEWLPIILGNQFMTTFGLWPLTKSYSSNYRSDIDPRITNEFAAAAFRFGHSLIPGEMLRVRRNRTGGFQSSMTKLTHMFFESEDFRKTRGLLDELVLGMIGQAGEQWDNAFAPEITDRLFERPRNAGGRDLVAMNIQRARDHGIKGYNSYREICRSGTGKAKNWKDFEDVIPAAAVRTLSQIYRHIDDVDLFVGGFLEQPHKDSMLGPTFKCIVGDQFARLKLGDSFFYDLGVDRRSRFSPEQLRQIRRASMARVLCDNTDFINSLQPRVFRTEGTPRTNQRASCSDARLIPHVNLGAFQEAPPNKGRR